MFSLVSPIVRIKILAAGIAFGIISFFILGCSSQGEEFIQLKPTEQIVVAEENATATTNPTPMLEIRSTLAPTLAPTFTPAFTPTINVNVFVPDQWTEVVEDALAVLPNDSAFQWATVTDESVADLALVEGEGDHLLKETSLALAVPFTAEMWELTTEQAQSVLETGDPMIEVVELSELTPERRALRIDGRTPFDPEYPLIKRWSISTNPGYEKAALILLESVTAQQPADRILKFAVVGDIMLDRSLGTMISQGNISFPFVEVEEYLSAADLTIGNLESSLGNLGQPASKSYTFQAPPEAALSLGSAGFDVLSLANNHALDFGTDALLQAIDLLEGQGIRIVGAGENSDAARKPLLLNMEEVSVAVLGYVDVPIEVGGFDTRSWNAGADAPGLAWADPAAISADVARAAETANIVIVLLHSGYEYIEQPSPEQIKASRAAIDAGADLVLGHHSHVLQGIEFYKEGVIAYGLGNFAFEIDGDPESAILNIWLDANGVIQLELVPTIIQFGGQPRLANPGEARKVWQRVYWLTDLANAN